MRLGELVRLLRSRSISHSVIDMSNSPFMLSRRQALVAGAMSLSMRLLADDASSRAGLIESIEQRTLWSNLDGAATTWFHPRACMVPAVDGACEALMTMQEITGSDYFGPVHVTTSSDLGVTWSEPQPIPTLGRRPVPEHEGLLQGVCDVVPEYHPQTNSVLALGHVVFYRGDRFSRGDQLARYPVYVVRRSDGTWSEDRRLEWDDPRGSFIYTNNCGQRTVLPNGDILLAFTFGTMEQHRSVAGVRCSFDGDHLQLQEVGTELVHPHGRGLLEPSLTQYRNRFYLTIRAEDDRGYVAVSDDGLSYEDKRAWSWDDGERLSMSTTQQHWLTHSDGLFLVYTRRDASNANVTRWRAPLFVAQVDVDRLVLLRDTEQVVHPLVGDGINDPDSVPLMGNFHITNASPMESWVTVGSWLPRRNAHGAMHLGKIRWAVENRLSFSS